MNTLKKTIALTAAAIALTCTAANAEPHRVLTLDGLKNATYRIAELSCAATAVKLKDGDGQAEGVHVVFGRAAFGYLPGKAHEPIAAAHIAYSTPEFGWQQQVVFFGARNNRLVQIAEYTLDDGETLTAMSFNHGRLELETAAPPADHKVTAIALHNNKEGCSLDIKEFDKDATGKLVARRDLSGYLTAVQDRVEKCWRPTRADRGERVGVAFTIDASGSVTALRVSNSSEVFTADEAAIDAVEQAAPFAPLPGSKPVNVCLDFQAGVCVKQ